MEKGAKGQRTLDISDALLKYLLKGLGVLELLLDLGDDGLGQLPLLPLLDLTLVAHPRIQHSLSLGGQSGGLLELVGLGLKLGSFLSASISIQHLRLIRRLIRI